jgi:hypothetical protein
MLMERAEEEEEEEEDLQKEQTRGVYCRSRGISEYMMPLRGNYTLVESSAVQREGASRRPQFCMGTFNVDCLSNGGHCSFFLLHKLIIVLLQQQLTILDYVVSHLFAAAVGCSRHPLLYNSSSSSSVLACIRRRHWENWNTIASCCIVSMKDYCYHHLLLG